MFIEIGYRLFLNFCIDYGLFRPPPPPNRALQVCILYNCKVSSRTRNKKIRDYSKFNKKLFLTDLQDKVVNVRDHTNVDMAFSTFYRKLDKTANKHAPFKSLPNRKAKQLSKPWITKGIRTSIRLKNKYYKNGERDKYGLYRNIIYQLTRHVQ